MLRSIPPPWWSSRSCGPVSMGHHMRTDRRSQMVQKKPQHSLDTFKLHWLWRRLFRHPLVWIYVCVTPHEFSLLVLCLVITLRPKPTLPCHCPAVDPFRRCSITRHPGTMVMKMRIPFDGLGVKGSEGRMQQWIFRGTGEAGKMLHVSTCCSLNTFIFHFCISRTKKNLTCSGGLTQMTWSIHSFERQRDMKRYAGHVIRTVARKSCSAVTRMQTAGVTHLELSHYSQIPYLPVRPLAIMYSNPPNNTFYPYFFVIHSHVQGDKQTNKKHLCCWACTFPTEVTNVKFCLGALTRDDQRVAQPERKGLHSRLSRQGWSPNPGVP